jgi:hypothetical protein
MRQKSEATGIDNHLHVWSVRQLVCGFNILDHCFPGPAISPTIGCHAGKLHALACTALLAPFDIDHVLFITCTSVDDLIFAPVAMFVLFVLHHMY